MDLYRSYDDSHGCGLISSPILQRQRRGAPGAAGPGADPNGADRANQRGQGHAARNRGQDPEAAVRLLRKHPGRRGTHRDTERE